MEAASQIPGVSFRHLVDPDGDTATFFTFILQDKAHCSRVNSYLKDEGFGAINWAENTWHFYPKWEHLLSGSTPIKSGWPFAEPGGRRRVVYDPQALPQSSALMDRTLVYPVPIKMDQEHLDNLCRVLSAAKNI